MGSRFRPAATLPILLFLQMICWVSGQYNIVPPDSPVMGIVGNGAVLPCQLEGEKILEELSVLWIFTGNSPEREMASFDGKNPHNQFLEFETYRGRTEFFPLEFHRGNLSLLLKNVQLSDKGKYICAVSLKNWYNEVVVELDVAAVGAEPSVFLDGHSGNGIGLSCRSQGWFPAPSMLWLDSQGRRRLEEVTTQSSAGPSSGVFDVVSSVSLEPGSEREVSCRVVSTVLNVTRESRVRTGGSRTQIKEAATSKKKARKDKEHLKEELETQRETGEKEINEKGNQLEQLTAKLDFWEARSHAVHVVLDPNTQTLRLERGPRSYPLKATVLVARKALGARKSYWEVKLNQAQSWTLGVLWDGQSRSRPYFRDSWALHGSHGKLSSTTDGSLRRYLCRDLSVVGVFLDSEKGEVEFYDAEQRDLLGSMQLGTKKKAMGKFFPFVLKRKWRPLQIRPVPIPVPLKKPLNVDMEGLGKGLVGRKRL